MNKEKIDEKFDNMLDQISHNVFRRYTSRWQDKDLVCETMENWDSETKETALDEIDELVNEEFEMKKMFESLRVAFGVGGIYSLAPVFPSDLQHLKDCVDAMEKYAFMR